MIEVQTGDYLGEDDIERFEDKYGRSEEERKWLIALFYKDCTLIKYFVIPVFEEIPGPYLLAYQEILD